MDRVVLVVLALVMGLVLGRRIRGRSAPTSGPADVVPENEPAPESLSVVGPDQYSIALGQLPMGVLLFDDLRAEVYRNQVADELLAQRVTGPLLAGEIGELLASRPSDAARESTLDLYGPPKRNLHLMATALDGSPGRGGWVVVVDDVTEQHRIDAVRRDFVANVSHELKTPVGAVGLLAEALVDEEDPETIRRLADRIQDESLRLGNTIDDLLALSAIESDQLQLARVSIAELRMGVEARSIGVAEHREIELTWDIADPDLWLEGDRRQLVSALGNVVDNALKYSEAGTAVTVSVDTQSAGEITMVTFVITDQGVGIPESDKERIFERFYRVDAARSRQTGGTGLGLSIVRHVARNHSGSVQVDSTEGVGTTFVLSFPQSQQQSTPTQEVVQA